MFSPNITKIQLNTIALGENDGVLYLWTTVGLQVSLLQMQHQREVDILYTQRLFVVAGDVAKIAKDDYRGGFRHVQHVWPNRGLTKGNPSGPQVRESWTAAGQFLACRSVLRH